MKFSVCIEPLFEEVSFYDRIAIAKECGADAIEFWGPEVYDCKKIGDIAANLNMPVAGCCVAEQWTKRMNLPWPVVKENLERSISFAKDLGTHTMIGLSGELECKVDSQKMVLIENLKRASEMLEKEGITLVMEALNSLYDHKGYYLDSAYVGFEIMKAVESPNVKLLYDCYHMQIMEGNMINTIKDNIDYIGHFHSAGVPGRHETFKGETNYPYLLKAIEEAGYDRYFGLEYWPTYDHKESLKDCLAYMRG